MALLFLTLLSPSFAKTIQDHNRFCTPEGSGWKLQSYAPLVDTRRGTTYVQAIYTGTWLQRVFVKKYNSRTELLYEYKFGEDGKLMALHGRIDRCGHWTAEADLYPDPDGSIPKPDVTYRVTQFGGIIQTPEDGWDYTKILGTVPVYRTIADVPCADLLKEAENKKNATQE
jgi:hypothetical protein